MNSSIFIEKATDNHPYRFFAKTLSEFLNKQGKFSRCMECTFEKRSEKQEEIWVAFGSNTSLWMFPNKEDAEHWVKIQNSEPSNDQLSEPIPMYMPIPARPTR